MISPLRFLQAFNNRFPLQQPPCLCQIVVTDPVTDQDRAFYIFDLYCDDTTCDCHKVSLIAYAQDKACATFAYGWKPFSFYRQWGLDAETARMLTKGFVDFMGPQSLYTDMLTDCFFQLIKDKQFVDNIKQRYAQFKAYDQNNNKNNRNNVISLANKKAQKPHHN